MAIRDAVVLAAGEGRRLRPMTLNRPKPMLPAGNRPILEHVFDALLAAGVERLVVVVGYRSDRVKSYFGPTYRDIHLEYVEQGKQLGSAHALLQANEALASDRNERFLVVNGDQLYAPSLVSAVSESDSDAPISIGVVRSERARDYGAVRMDGHRIVEFVERPGSDEYRMLNSGVYAATPDLFEAIEATDRENGELALPNVIGRLLERGRRVDGIRSDGWWDDATFPWDLLRLTETVLASQRVDLPSVEGSHRIWVSPSASVHDRAILRPPVAIGPDATIGPASVVGPDVALGRNVTVNAGTIVERSVIDADSRIGAGSTLIDAVLGQGVSIGPANTVTGGPGDVRIDDRIYVDRPLGALLADRVRTEGDVAFRPGTLVGPNAALAAGTTVSGLVERDAEVR